MQATKETKVRKLNLSKIVAKRSKQTEREERRDQQSHIANKLVNSTFNISLPEDTVLCNINSEIAQAGAHIITSHMERSKSSQLFESEAMESKRLADLMVHTISSQQVPSLSSVSHMDNIYTQGGLYQT